MNRDGGRGVQPRRCLIGEGQHEANPVTGGEAHGEGQHVEAQLHRLAGHQGLHVAFAKGARL